MRNFYVLTYDDRDDLKSVSDYETGDFDLTVFWSGLPYQGLVPENVRLYVEEGECPDYMANPISWPIVSEQLLLHMMKLAPDIQVFPAPLYYENSLQRLTGYSIVNIVRRIDALSQPFETVNTIVFTCDKIPKDVHLFRITDHETLVIISDEMLKELSDKMLRGFAFIKTVSV